VAALLSFCSCIFSLYFTSIKEFQETTVDSSEHVNKEEAHLHVEIWTSFPFLLLWLTAILKSDGAHKIVMSIREGIGVLKDLIFSGNITWNLKCLSDTDCHYDCYQYVCHVYLFIMFYFWKHVNSTCFLLCKFHTQMCCTWRTCIEAMNTLIKKNKVCYISVSSGWFK
jgi:hypothetical protein